MSDAPTSAELTSRPASAQDRPGGCAPKRIAEVLVILAILATYGRHLARTLERRAVMRGFATIARFFGTAKVETIAAHLQRGLMRLIALESILLRRALRGGDLPIQEPRAASRRVAPAKDAAVSGPEAGSASSDSLTAQRDAIAPAPATSAGERLARRIARDQPLTLDTLPRMKAIVAEALRRPVGCTIAAICRDFGISPMLCNGFYWNKLYDAIKFHRGSASGLVLDVKRCEQRFNKEEWKHPGLELAEETREGARRVLGFFIGQDPVWPFAVAEGPGAAVVAVATGPP